MRLIDADALSEEIESLKVSSYENEIDGITHWIPLPEPPEGYTATLSMIDNLKAGNDK